MDEASSISRDVLCSRGHVLENDSCLANYSGQELTYRLSFSLRWSGPSKGDEAACIGRGTDGTLYATDLSVIVDQVTEQILSGLIHHDFNIKPFYNNGSVDTACNQKAREFKLTSLSKLLFSVTIGYAGESVDDLERLMLGFLDKAYTVNIGSDSKTNSQCSIILQTYKQSQQVSTNDDKLPDHLKFCRYSKELPGIDFLLPNVVIVLDQFLVCPQFEFNEKKFVFNQATDSVTIANDLVTLESGSFQWQGAVIRVCVSDYVDRLTQKPVQISQPVLMHYPLFSKITLGISISFLAVTLLVHTIFRSLRNHSGKNTMVLIFCLLCTQVLQEASLQLDNDTAGCNTVLILMHYFWLSCLCMVKLCLLHLLKLYYRASLCDKTMSDNGRKQFCGYLMYTFGVPLTIMVAVVCFVIIPSSGQLGDYDGELCIGSDIDVKIVTFTASVGLIFSANVIYFGFAFLVIRTKHSVKNSRHLEENIQRDIRVAAIVSISWWLYFLDSFVGFPFFSFVVQLMNSLQGLFIFINYVCREKTLAILKREHHP